MKKIFKELTEREARKIISSKKTYFLDNGEVLALMFGATPVGCIVDRYAISAEIYEENGVIIVVQCLNRLGKSISHALVKEYEGKADAFIMLDDEERDEKCTAVRKEFLSAIGKEMK